MARTQHNHTETRERGSVDTVTASGVFSSGGRRLVTQEYCTSHDVFFQEALAAVLQSTGVLERGARVRCGGPEQVRRLE